MNRQVGISTSVFGFGLSQGGGVQDVETSLTITFVRDLAMPHRNEILPLEHRFWQAHPAYRERAAREYMVSNHDSWPEIKVLRDLIRQAHAIRNRKADQLPTQASAPQQQAPQAADQPPAPVTIPAEPPEASFSDMEVTHNVFQSNQPGIQIRLQFNIKHRRGLQCRMVAYFTDANQNPLKDVNQRFKTADGKVSVGSLFTPSFDDSYYNSYILFMPYAELDQQDGEHELGVDARIYDEVTKAFLATCTHTTFRYTQKGASMRGENLATHAKVAAKPASRTAARPAKKAEPAPASAAPKPLSPEEMKATYQKSYGWEKPTKDQDLYLDAVALDWAGKNAAAEKLVKKAIDLNPKEPRYWQNLIMGALQKGKPDQAVKHLKKALEHMPGSPFMLKLLGHTHVLKGEFGQAQAVADELKSSKEDSADIQYKYLAAEIAEARKDYKAAIRFYDKADSMLAPETQKAMGFNQKRCRDLMKAAKKK